MRLSSLVVSCGRMPDTPEGWQRIWVQLENGYSFILSVDEGTDHPSYYFTQCTERRDSAIYAHWDDNFGSALADMGFKVKRTPRMLKVQLLGSREAYLAFKKATEKREVPTC